MLPALECLVDDGETVLSVDTSNPALMRQAAELGADMINDVRALRRNGALQAVAESGMSACLMPHARRAGHHAAPPRIIRKAMSSQRCAASWPSG